VPGGIGHAFSLADLTGTTAVATDPEALFDSLSEVGNLPRYLSRITSARSGEGEEVHTTATLEDGREVEGTAWFRVDDSATRIEWGSEGPSSYSGSLQVRAAGDGSEVEVHLHTTRVPDGDQEVQDGIAETLANIRAQAGSAA